MKPESFYEIISLVANSTKTKSLWGFRLFNHRRQKKLIKYTSSYLPDITVLVSSPGTPIVKSFDEVHGLMKGMTAITIRGTIYEGFLLDLRNKINADFDIKYISSDDNVLDHISQTPNSFGFMDLPIYLMWVKNGTPLVRQNFFTVNGIGYGFIIPKTSDWDIPFKQFLNTPKYRDKIGSIISRHIGSEIYEFLDNLSDRQLLGTTLLTKEKEMHQAIIKNATARLAKEEIYRYYL